MIRKNWIHHNWGVGGWADTNNANTTWTATRSPTTRTAAIWEEISYNFSITDNYIARNNLTDGPEQPRLPHGRDLRLRVRQRLQERRRPAVPDALVRRVRRARPPDRSVIAGNTLVDNGGGVFLWQNSNRHCGDGFDGVCPAHQGRPKGPFSKDGLRREPSQAPPRPGTARRECHRIPRAHNYWDGCMWQTQNVHVTRNLIVFDPDRIPGCTTQAWPACGANGVFSAVRRAQRDARVRTSRRRSRSSRTTAGRENVYVGPSRFFAWNQGNLENPVSWRPGPARSGGA